MIGEERALVESASCRGDDPTTPHVRALEGVPAVGERRLAPRVSIALPVRFHTPTSDRSHVGQLVDLSLGGAFVRAELPPAPGTPVAFSCCFARGADALLMSCWCDVAWAVPARGFGVRFIGAPRPALQVIQELVLDRLLPLPSA